MGKVECANRDSVSGGVAVDGACIGSPSGSSGRAGPEYPQPLPQGLASLHAPWFQQQGLKILTFSRILYNQNKESSPSSHSPMCFFLFASVSGPRLILAISGCLRVWLLSVWFLGHIQVSFMEDPLCWYPGLSRSSQTGDAWVLTKSCQGKEEPYWYSLAKYLFTGTGLGTGNWKNWTVLAVERLMVWWESRRIDR